MKQRLESELANHHRTREQVTATHKQLQDMKQQVIRDIVRLKLRELD